MSSNSNSIKKRPIWDIPGGIHPPQRKSLSLQTNLQDGPIPEELVLPIGQHIGAPAEPIVVVGEHVLKGQKIAEAKGFVSAPLHAPSSGEITAIETLPIAHPSGMNGTCIVIKTDGLDEWIDHQGVADFKLLPAHELVNRIRDAGITGLGGAGFPTSVKLSPQNTDNIHTLIINGVECEPYITADDILMREKADDIVTGISIIAHILQPREILIGVEDNKPLAIKALTEASRIANLDNDISVEVVTLPTKYPSGGEKQLIQILTGKEIPSGGIPADLGIVSQNVGTVAAVAKAIIHGEPLISRITTLTGEGLSSPQNLEVLLGTRFADLLDFCGVDNNKLGRLIMGGPMMGFTVDTDQVSILKTTNCILVPSKEELTDAPPAQACIRCGHCEEACPVSLLPQQLYWFSQGKEFEKLQSHNLFDCIECGACSYVCPSNIPLVQYYRSSKGEIRLQEQANIKSERSKQRFDFRQERLQKEADAKEAKRKARAEAAAKTQAAKKAAAESGETTKDPKADAIAAAVERAKAKKAAKTAAAENGSASNAETNTETNTEKPAKKAKPQLTEEQKQLKMEVALAKAAVKKLQRTMDQENPQQTNLELSGSTGLQQELADAKNKLVTAEKALDASMTADITSDISTEK